MKEMRVVHRYADALFGLASTKGETGRVRKDLEQWVALVSKQPKVLKLLTNPTIGREERCEWVRANWRGHFAPITVRFLEVLISKGRMDHLHELVVAFVKRVKEAEGQVEVRVRSARVLTKDHVRQLKESLEKRLNAKVYMELAVDERLMAGLVAEYGNQVIDGSAQTRLKELSNRLITYSD